MHIHSWPAAKATDLHGRLHAQEIDYVLEGQNADRFRTNFEKTPWIKVPTIIWPLTTERVLTMEYVPGVKINRADDIDALGVDRTLLAQRAVESYLQQLLTFGFFHAGRLPPAAAPGHEVIWSCRDGSGMR